MPARSLLEAYLWIVNKGTPLAAVWGEFAGGCVLETFDDGRLAGSIVANDEGKGGVELNSLTHSWAEGPDTGDGELVYSRHGLQAGSQELCSILCLQETLALVEHPMAESEARVGAVASPLRCYYRLVPVSVSQVASSHRCLSVRVSRLHCDTRSRQRLTR